RELVRNKRVFMEIMSHHTGKTISEVEADSDRNYYMTAEEAQAYGLIDEVVTRDGMILPGLRMALEEQV
ncbi:MAG: ATP-dependent Clp protease proteolytic subunit, partial [Deinococcota bacterium]